MREWYCRTAFGKCFAFWLHQRENLPIKHRGREIFRFSLILSIGCRIDGLMERQGQSDSRLAPKVIAPFHSSLYCTHSLPDKRVIYSDSNLLLPQNIFAVIFCAPINNYIKRPKSLLVQCLRDLRTHWLIPGRKLGDWLCRVSVAINQKVRRRQRRVWFQEHLVSVYDYISRGDSETGIQRTTLFPCGQ
jgi:hypothetical protein